MDKALMSNPIYAEENQPVCYLLSVFMNTPILDKKGKSGTQTLVTRSKSKIVPWFRAQQRLGVSLEFPAGSVKCIRKAKCITERGELLRFYGSQVPVCCYLEIGGLGNIRKK